jgi:hypothetical protein
MVFFSLELVRQLAWARIARADQVDAEDFWVNRSVDGLELDPAIPGTSLTCVVAADGVGSAAAHSIDPLGCNAVVDQLMAHRFCSTFR